jgi:hypothetical protein
MIWSYQSVVLPVPTSYGGSDASTKENACGEYGRVNGDGSWHKEN